MGDSIVRSFDICGAGATSKLSVGSSEDINADVVGRSIGGSIELLGSGEPAKGSIVSNGSGIMLSSSSGDSNGGIVGSINSEDGCESTLTSAGVSIGSYDGMIWKIGEGSMDGSGGADSSKTGVISGN